ncbi:phosphotransferase family protein [Cellulomonas xiejunii]|uniref:Aminoglycoside phosphotransferase family protein n=1 Tax=Cellulomonas xiejunii TaxID=2968083 RepID=A0ABY5KRM3_9CELL|nr:aminoglycoside phosphotransferase family protein [Cellulomonas xiejunii]MCC2322347.1 aminoglycoside phosphotransferase family protein [Cellulomonas xiejunii]UUI72399.1 aminoglycoside phosphotransferase family protein [Cellulomonas xiejunii]
MHPGDVAPHAYAPSDDAPGHLLTSGTSADVYAIDDERVLRRYREGRDAAPEVDLLRHVRSHDFPAPDVLRAGGPDIVMTRMHGPTLLQALAAGEFSLPDAAHVLADLHAMLHAVPAPQSWQVPRDRDWPQLGGGPVVVHLDLHPGNVVLTEQGPMLVDWANAATGTPELDVAVTAVLIAEVAVDAGGDYSQAARAVVAAFLHASDVSPLTALDDAVALRSGAPGLLPGERELVPQAGALVRTMLALTERR